MGNRTFNKRFRIDKTGEALDEFGPGGRARDNEIRSGVLQT